MPNPQLEDGFLRIANELAEVFGRTRLNAYESGVLWIILRATYGWSKKSATLSINWLSARTGLDRRNVRRAINGLLRKDLISRVRDGNSWSYCLQKDYTRWKDVRPVTSVQSDPSVPIDATEGVYPDASPGVPIDALSSVYSAPHKRKKTVSKAILKESADSASQDSPTVSRPPKYLPGSPAFDEAVYLRERISQYSPRTVVPKPDPTDRRMQAWAQEMDRLNRLGAPGGEGQGYEWSEIRKIVDWMFDVDDFWRDNIESPAKLREQVVKMENKMRQNRKQVPAPPEHHTPVDYKPQRRTPYQPVQVCR